MRFLNRPFYNYPADDPLSCHGAGQRGSSCGVQTGKMFYSAAPSPHCHLCLLFLSLLLGMLFLMTIPMLNISQMSTLNPWKMLIHTSDLQYRLENTISISCGYNSIHLTIFSTTWAQQKHGFVSGHVMKVFLKRVCRMYQKITKKALTTIWKCACRCSIHSEPECCQSSRVI